MDSSYISCGSIEETGLSSREREIIALVGAGYTNRQLARKLGISEDAARYHLTSVFEKLGVSNRIELILHAAHQALLHED